MNQAKQQTLSFIVGRRGLGLGQVFPNFLWQCTPSAFRYMHITSKNFYDKKAEGNNKN